MDQLEEVDENLEWLLDVFDQTFPSHPDIADARAVTRLHLASRSGNYEAVRSLIELGANLTITTSQGYTALSLAGEHQSVIQLLEEKGAVDEGVFDAGDLPELYCQWSPPPAEDLSYAGAQNLYAQER